MSYIIPSSEDFHQRTNIFAIYNISEHHLIETLYTNYHHTSPTNLTNFNHNYVIIYVPFNINSPNISTNNELKSDYIFINNRIKNFNIFITQLINYIHNDNSLNNQIYINLLQNHFDFYIHNNHFKLFQDKITNITSPSFNILSFAIDKILRIKNYNNSIRCT